MPDEIDNANDHAEKTLAAAIAHQRNQVDTMPPCGKCYNCGDPVGDAIKYCDRDCATDHEYRLKRNN